ncbi:acetyl-CoA carboxylase biotin carboxylase subunit family protein [Streptomyces sp. R28]|uniref:Acetyl-CoA carboxylase biotin carboxylase subunit family protein n=1 Tax=Streptomyces sp. R28 TaxID=3238628 RepID=A0AB39Q9S4_9ACTN
MSNLPLLAVVYDRGSAGAVEIVASARKLCSVLFVCDESLPGAADTARQLGELAQVLDVTGMSPEKAGAALSALDVRGIVTFSERRLAATAELAAASGLPFHTPDVVAGLVDKQRQRARLHAAGVQSTRCEAVRSVDDVPEAAARVGLPAVLKPRSGAGSVNTCRVDDLGQLVAVTEEFMADGAAEYVLEELLVGDPGGAGAGFGDYVSVESVTSGGVVHHVCVTGKLPLAEPFRETGMFQPASLSPVLRSQVLALTEAAIHALGITGGVTHVEIKLTPDGPRLIEVNGRMGGYVGALLRRSARFDLLRAALREALSLPVDLPELSFPAVEYVYFVTPPADSGQTLTAMHGLDEVAALDGVWQVKAEAAAGRSLDWRNGTEGHLGTVHGTAADHDRLRVAIAAIESAIVLESA